MRVEARDDNLFLVRVSAGPYGMGRIVDDSNGRVSSAMLFGSLLSQFEWQDVGDLAPAKCKSILARVRVAQKAEEGT